MTKHKYKVGDKVVFTNCFGVCWGVKTITALDEHNGPTYHYTPTDTPWFSTNEEHLTLADEDDIKASLSGDESFSYFQSKYGFMPTETYGCW